MQADEVTVEFIPVSNDFAARAVSIVTSNLPTPADVLEVNSSSVTGVADFKADVSGLATSASIAALNDFDPANDTVANVTTVGSVTGSVGSISGITFPTGFSSLTVSAVADGVWDEAQSGHTTVGTFGYYLDDQISGISGGGGGATDWTATERNQIRYRLGVDGTTAAPSVNSPDLATQASVNTVDTVVDSIKVDTTNIVTDTGTTIPNQISSLNDIAATDIVSNGAITTLAGAVVNVDTVDVTTTNSDMRGTDNAATQTSVNTIDTEVGQIKAKTDQLTFTVANQVDANALTGGGGDATAANQTSIINHLTDVKGTGFAKDTHSLTDITADVTGINGAAMRGTDGAYTGTPPTEAQIYSHFTAGTNEDAFKADVSGLSTFNAATDTVSVGDKTGFALSSAANDAIGAAFLAYTLTKGAPGTVERAFWQALKTQAATDGEVSGTPTASEFDTNLTAVTGAYDHLLLLFTSGSLAGEARPISTYNNTNGRVVLQDPLTAAPSAADEFIIVPDHTTPESDIADAILSRNVSNVEVGLGEHTLGTIVLCILESVRSGTTWTIKRSDSTTTHVTKTLTLDPGADPVIGVD
jgi:hypothetical protein